MCHLAKHYKCVRYGGSGGRDGQGEGVGGVRWGSKEIMNSQCPNFYGTCFPREFFF